ncbi:MAG: hypothetical protein QNJ22_02165 [Desulfosarcinaceae bacterium]|nr:hypothetical protein [Desulfosarcinaceae bacterium]
MAQILDISVRGIAFRFFVGSLDGHQVTKIDITLPNRGIALQGLPVQAVSETADHSSGNRHNDRVRRLGMCFRGLPTPTVRALDALIERFACGRLA